MIYYSCRIYIHVHESPPIFRDFSRGVTSRNSTKNHNHGATRQDRCQESRVNHCVQARVADMVRKQRQQMDGWRQQNEQDQRVDMQQLEGLMLQVRPPILPP
jgi:hypothetical protein